MKAEPRKTIFGLVMMIVFGVFMGYQISRSFDDPAVSGLGFVVFILLAKFSFQQSCIVIIN